MFNNNIDGPRDSPPPASLTPAATSSKESEKKIAKKSVEIVKMDASGLSGSDKLMKKTERALNFLKAVDGYINAHTIITGSSTDWDPKRLKKKHATLALIGADHVTIKSKTLSKVDAHYLSAETFISKLEELGGKRYHFDYSPDPALNNGRPCSIKVNDVTIQMHEIDIPKEQQVVGRYGNLAIRDDFVALLGKPQYIINGPKGKFYLVDEENLSKIEDAKLRDGNNFKDGVNIKVTGDEKPLVNKTTFPGMKFDKTSSEFAKAKTLLEDLGIEKASWRLVETENALFIVPRGYRKTIGLAAKKSGTLGGKKPDAVKDPSSRGTVLMTMNQNNIYEQYLHEMLTFAFEGVNVMMYNNPGKGLSKGSPDIENINASIEASYSYLSQFKHVPDKKILAKGQCFGAAPTARLGKAHPEINLMMDQNPANFYDIALAQIEAVADDLKAEDRNVFKTLASNMIKDNFLVSEVTKAIFSGYDVPEDLRHNHGHKLFHYDVPTATGFGGDKLVPEEHLALMIDSAPKIPDKEIAISENPGGHHATDWWLSEESETAVLAFLKRTGISQSHFE